MENNGEKVPTKYLVEKLEKLIDHITSENYYQGLNIEDDKLWNQCQKRIDILQDQINFILLEIIERSKEHE